MKVIQVDLYRDGGTRAVVTDEGTWYIMSRSPLVFNKRDPFAGRVTDNWPREGGKVVDEVKARQITELAQAWESGRDQALSYTYNEWDVRIIAEDFAKEQMGVVNTTRFRDWFKTHPKNKLNQ